MTSFLETLYFMCKSFYYLDWLSSCLVWNKNLHNFSIAKMCRFRAMKSELDSPQGSSSDPAYEYIVAQDLVLRSARSCFYISLLNVRLRGASVPSNINVYHND